MPPELCETPLEIPVVALDFVLAAIVDALAANAPRHPTLIWVIVRFRTSSSTVMLNSKSLREGTLVLILIILLCTYCTISSTSCGGREESWCVVVFTIGAVVSRRK